MTRLNLLGVVYHTSGRHRLAVKLFANAIAVDDLDGGFHYNTACSYQAIGEQIAAAEHFRTAIALGMSEKRSVEELNYGIHRAPAVRTRSKQIILKPFGECTFSRSPKSEDLRLIEGSAF